MTNSKTGIEITAQDRDLISAKNAVLSCLFANRSFYGHDKYRSLCDSVWSMTTVEELETFCSEMNTTQQTVNA